MIQMIQHLRTHALTLQLTTLFEETKAKISIARQGKKPSNETKAKISITISGNNNPFFGKKHSQEALNQIRDAKTGSANPIFGKSKSTTFERHKDYFTFRSLPGNPKFKGTYVLAVAEGLQYGPYLKIEALKIYHISSRKYYAFINTNIAYNGHMFSYTPFDNVPLIATGLYTPESESDSNG